MSENTGYKTLEDRRNKAKLNMAYKIINDKVILSSNMLPRPIRPLRNCNVGSVGTENQLFEPISRLKTVEKTFFYQVPKLWNNIVTREQASAPSLDSFKNQFIIYSTNLTCYVSYYRIPANMVLFNPVHSCDMSH